jgi:hypothetical protein
MDAPRQHIPREVVVTVHGQPVVVREITPTQAPVVFGFLERLTAGLAGVSGLEALSRLVLDDSAIQAWIVAECTDSPWPVETLGLVATMKILRAWFEVNADFFGEALTWTAMAKTLLAGPAPDMGAMPMEQAA